MKPIRMDKYRIPKNQDIEEYKNNTDDYEI